MNPSVSVVIPSYNRPDFLYRLLASIQKQKFRDFEVIVVDDCSPRKEEIERVVDSFREAIPELQFVENEENRGAPYSRNIGIKHSRADWIALVDDDDEWMPEKLARQISIIENSSDQLGLVYTWANVVENGQIIRQESSAFKENSLNDLLKSNFIPSSSVLVKKKALFEAGLFDETFLSCQDWDMWVRIVNLGYQLDVVPSYEINFHKHTSGSIGVSETAIEGYRQFYRKHIGKYRTIDPFFYYTFRVKNRLRTFLRMNRAAEKKNSLD